jgi:hypothetical protein
MRERRSGNKKGADAAKQVRYVVDKSLSNFEYVGLIHLAFPNAKLGTYAYDVSVFLSQLLYLRDMSLTRVCPILNMFVLFTSHFRTQNSVFLLMRSSSSHACF